MSVFTIERHTGLGVEDAWAAVTDFSGHGEVVPATVMRTEAGEPRPGWRFAAGTGRGRARIWDHMIVTIWSPPGTQGPGGAVRIVKIGAWVRGWAHIEVEPEGEGARITWTEDLGPRLDPLPKLTAPISRRLGERLFATTLDRLLAQASPRD